MITADKYNITNARMVAKLLPFWSRGVKMQKLLNAMLHPLISLHNAFKAWAIEMLIAAHITAQPRSLVWYLNYKLRKHFRVSGDSFQLTNEVVDAKNIIYYTDEWLDTQEHSHPVFPRTGGQERKNMVIYRLAEMQPDNYRITILAPAIKEGDYDTMSYLRDIKKIADTYIVNNKRYKIIILT